MKIDRRSFLSFVIGGAAGTSLSPLPWKLTDDLSIWTQNWPWTPVPPDGEVSYVNSVCELCPGGCGITVRKIDDRAIKIEGMKGHPVNDGRICILGLSGLQLLYGPTRITTPLKRSGKRGSGSWQKISWQEAISEVVAKLDELRQRKQTHTLACISQKDIGTVPKLLQRFLTVYGSLNFMRMPSIQDTYELTLHLMQGVRGSAGFDIENSDFVLSFGSGIIEGWGSPVRMFLAHSKLLRNGATVVQIEPRLSLTASKASKWIPVNPGTEAALALGIAHVIIQKSLFKPAFVENYVFGFKDWTDNQGNPVEGFQKIVLRDYTPDQVSKITGVEKKIIVSLAEAFARAKRPLAICGRGQGRIPGGIREFMAVHALNALVGNLNKKGGVWALPNPDYIRWPEPEMDQIASAGIQKGRLDEAGTAAYPHSRYLTERFIENINAKAAYPINMLFVAGANPLYALSDTEATRTAFNNVPYIVSFSSYMDETSQQADLILPNHIYLERYEDLPQPLGLQRPIIGLMRPVVRPLYNTRHVGDVVLQMAKGLGGAVAKAFPWKNYESCLEDSLGHKLDTLLKQGYWMDRGFSASPWNRAFHTPSGKFEFVVSSDSGKKHRLSPGYKSPEPAADSASYPLLLIPYDSMRLLANDFLAAPPFLVKTVEDIVLKGKDLFVEINPETARRLKLSEGKYARLTTPKGAVRVKVHLYDGIMPGIIALPRGLGHTAPRSDRYLTGKGINFNELIGPVLDPDSGLNEAWGIRAQLSKA
ncbi:MAG: molybdopterin-dependent oxidoreductase [Deltaproteobacteria bacterium]|nr:molybdopterin-dependent oxidoreductase [Deltaproteobacteria bacterium]MBW2150667.1 molybdopterin-dependent oxidoreductase [Deltaproteobacteria bacterium]